MTSRVRSSSCFNHEYNSDLGDRFDLNTKGSLGALEPLAANRSGRGFGGLRGGEAALRADGGAVLDYRKENGIFYSLDELVRSKVSARRRGPILESSAAVGAFALLGAESVGPAVGADLQKKALFAIAFSLVGMLVYIWIRFQLPYAIGAVAALFHDVLITLTAIAVTGREINLPTVAAMLTLVGYSVNDTVVVFDRVRENLRLHRGEDLEKLMNLRSTRRFRAPSSRPVRPWLWSSASTSSAAMSSTPLPSCC